MLIKFQCFAWLFAILLQRVRSLTNMLTNCAAKKNNENYYNHNLKKKLFSVRSQIKPAPHLIATFSMIHYITVPSIYIYVSQVHSSLQFLRYTICMHFLSVPIMTDVVKEVH